MDDLPVQTGSYTLFIKWIDSRDIEIGKLGLFRFPTGIYAYQGSARGPGGIRARLGRHVKGYGKVHWHIDYLNIFSEVLGYVYSMDEEKKPGNFPKECAWSQGLIGLPGASVPVPRFGASDCKSGCPAHLVHLSSDVLFNNELKGRLDGIYSTEILEMG